MSTTANPGNTRASSSPRFISVAIPAVPRALTYALPENAPEAEVGDEVTAPLGSRQCRGWVLETDINPDRESRKQSQQQTQEELFGEDGKNSLHGFKEIIAVNKALHPAQMELFEWMSEYYGVSIAEVLSTAVPKRFAPKKVTFIELSASTPCSEEQMAKLRKRAPKQARVVEELIAAGKALSINEFSLKGSSLRSALRTLEKKEIILSVEKDEVFTVPSATPGPATAHYGVAPGKLSENQQLAVNKITRAIDAEQFSPNLLFGVTGSGKTEVYLRSIQHALAKNGSALLLVPEISLTPQLVDHLTARLQEPLALLHSQVSPAQRWRYWEALREGTVRVAVGARSALFAPLRNLQLILIDEEHETSYKQSEGFRYHARDVAVMRAKTEGCTLVLGSATPSLETLANVQRKRYRLLELPERVHKRAVPKIEIVDLLKTPLKHMPAPTISPPLYEAIERTLREKEQAVILYNKRGFASYLQCDSCGETVVCSDCSVALTYHKKRNFLLCHYCGRQEAVPERCGYCCDPSTVVVEEEGAKLPGTLSHRGAGTERVIEDLRTLFPEAVLARMDRDTVGAKDSYRQILDSMRSGEADILVGTQMIAKGHDLPGVTLVGVIDADVGLHVPDFRTSERVYQLITQAAGRAGRGAKPGRVLVQTRQANHPTIVATATGRFLAFAKFQLEQREKLGYPPYTRLLRIIVSAEQQRVAIATAESLLERYHSLATQKQLDVMILGPAPAPHQRLRGLFRWHLLIKAKSAIQLATIAHCTHIWRRSDFRQARIAVDVDPVEML